MLANGRETNRKEEEYITTQMATGKTFCVFNSSMCLLTDMRDFSALESSMAKAFSSTAPSTNTKETSSMAGGVDLINPGISLSRLEGEGIMSHRDGHIFDGKFQNWRKHGEGKMTYRNGDIYTGVWDGDKGTGTIAYTDGSSYEVPPHPLSPMPRESS